MVVSTRTLVLTSLLLIALLSFTSALPSSAADNVDVCLWQHATPDLYHWYTEPDCQARHHTDGKSENCQQIIDDKNKICDSFCQIRTQFHYGQEQPYLSLPMYGGKAKDVILPDFFHQTYHWESTTNKAFKEPALMTG